MNITKDERSLSLLICSYSLADAFRDILFRAGFELLAERDVESSRSIPMALTSRDDPLTAVLIGDMFPMVPNTSGNTRYDNARLGTLEDIARWLSKSHSGLGHAWWTATTSEATVYANKIFGADVVGEAFARLNHMRTEMEPPFPVTHVYDGYMIRARVYRVQHNRREYICKVFKNGRGRFLQNEAEMLNLSGQFGGIPGFRDQNNNWVLSDYIPDAISVYDRRLVGLGIPLRMTLHIFRFVEQLHDEGIALLDFSPQNVLVDVNGKLWFIDFELLHYYERPPELRENYVFTGYPFGSEIDGLYQGKLGYPNIWYPVTGVKLESLLSGNCSLAIRDRCVFSLIHEPARLVRRGTKHIATALNSWRRNGSQ